MKKSPLHSILFSKAANSVTVVLLIGITNAVATPINNDPSPSTGIPLEIPVGPLLRPAPTFSQWTVKYAYQKDGPQRSGDEIVQAVTTRTGDIIREELVNSRNSRGENWFVKDVQYKKPLGKSEWYESSPGPNGEATRESDYSPPPENGFRDWDWISDASYAGIVDYKGYECLVFVPGGPGALDLTNPGDLSAEIAKQPLVAFVDSTTRLPLAMRSGDVTRTYQFGPPPATALSLPVDLAEQIRKGEEARNRLHQRPPRPY